MSHLQAFFIVNVPNSIVAANTTVAEILRRVPEFRVLDDRVVMIGKSKLVIMVNGRRHLNILRTKFIDALKAGWYSEA
jgi:hypothetical protein